MGRPRRPRRTRPQGRLLSPASPYGALAAIEPSGGRWLGPRDGDALRALLTSRYGQTYAHRRLYTPGALEDAWRDQALLSLGQWTDGTLTAHTGFWFSGDRDLVESGLTVTRPGLPATPGADLDALWGVLLRALSSAGVRALTQRTTTLHPIAQHLALTHMRALPSGLRPHYTRGERINGLDHAPDVMHALSMVTPLHLTAHACAVPDDAWGGWLSRLAAPLGFRCTTAPPVLAKAPLHVTLTADDPAFGARAARVEFSGFAELERALAPPTRRLELRHVPTQDPALVVTAHDALLARGFLPVGWRTGEVPELVYQLIPFPRETAASMRDASLANPALQTIWNSWRTLCAHTS